MGRRKLSANRQTLGSIKSPCPWSSTVLVWVDALEAGHLDGAISCHYRLLPLLYARESDLAITTLETAIAAQQNQESCQGLRAHPPNDLPKTRREGAGAV